MKRKNILFLVLFGHFFITNTMEIGRKYNFGKEFRVVKVDRQTIRAYFIKNLGNGTSLDIILEKKLKPVEFFCTKKYWKNSFFPEFCELDDEVCSTIDEARMRDN